MASLRNEWLLSCLLASLWLPGAVSAAVPPKGELRFTAALEEPVWVGEQVELYLELWTDGFSFADQRYVLPEVPGAYLLQADATTIKLSERREGAVWQGLRYVLLLYPQRAGRLEVPPFDVSFTAGAGFGSAPASFKFRTGAVAIEARLPEGAKPGGLLVSARQFTVQAHWDRDLPKDAPLQLQVGDAIALEVTRRADEVPAMVFAPLPIPAIDGLGAYAGTADVIDRANRGELLGERVDRLTLICERPGNFLVPEWRFQWWDPDRQRLSETVIPALPIEVHTNPAYNTAAGQGGATGPGGAYRTLYLALLAVLVVAVAWHRLGGAVRQRLRGTVRRKQAVVFAPPERTGRLLPLNPRKPVP